MANLSRTTVALAFSASLAAVAGCDVPETATGLHPEGPPMLQQVFMKDVAPDATGGLRVSTILAFGTHDNVIDSLEHPAMAAAASAQSIRLVFDELLMGNHLEEILCESRDLPGGSVCAVPGSYSRVPDGTTPDDVADCAVPQDLLDSSCAGPHAVCLNGDGVPCGVADEDENGSADDTRLIAGQVRVICDGIDVPLNPANSFWQPAGNQLVPARLTPDGSLGPAIILHTSNAGFVAPGVTPDDDVLPTDSTCSVSFAPDVTDKHGNQICAPANGDITLDCTPGDMSAFSFRTEKLLLSSTFPEADMVGAGRFGRVTANFRAPVSRTALSGVSISPTVPNLEIRASQNSVVITTCTQTPPTPPAVCGGSGTMTTVGMFDANTTYTVTIADVTDTFGKPIEAPVVFSFTTGN